MSKICGQEIYVGLVFADLYIPQILDLLTVIASIEHAPTVDAHLAVGQWH